MIPGRARRASNGSRWRVALIDSNGDAIVWSLHTGRAMRLHCDGCTAYDAAFADRAVGVLRMRGVRMEVAVYPTGAVE